MQGLIHWLEALAQQVSVTWFVFIGSFIEEVIAPIPSPLVMMLGGSIAASQNNTVLFLLFLAAVGALSKTIGSLIMYVLADKAEDFVINKFGRFIGVSRNDTEGLGKFLSKGKRDDIAIFLMRAIPIMPTAPVSIIAGIIKIKLKTYLISTFLGLIVRNFIYLYLGYSSLDTLESLNEGFDSLENIGYLVLSVIGGITLLWLYRKRQKGKVLDLVETALKKVKRLLRMKA